MTQRLRGVRIEINEQGIPFAEVRCDTQVGVKWYPEDPVPLQLGGPVAADFQEQFGAAQQERIANLNADVEYLNQQLSASAATVESLTLQKQSLQDQLTAMTAERDALQEQLNELTQPE